MILADQDIRISVYLEQKSLMQQNLTEPRVIGLIWRVVNWKYERRHRVTCN